jgi:cysteine-rich repeat protein
VDSCQAGTCTSTTRNCSDDNDCTTGFCDESGNTCVQEPVSLCCGNGIVEEGEECDEGTENSDEPNATCRTDCRASRCGNGLLDNLFGETCDLGEANSDEPNASCRTDCLEQRCGDGVVDDLSGEQCDDGDTGPDDGCSPRCFVDPPPTASLIPGTGSTKTDCIIEWKMDDVAFDKKGRTSHHQSCVDGDLACDHDGAVNGQCIFHVWLCSNNTDPNLPLCQAGTGPNGKGVVVVVQAKEPNLKQALKVPAHGETRKQLLRAGAVAPVGNGRNVCGPRLSLRVPHKALGRKGVTAMKIKAITSLNVKDTDILRLTCWP